jgi:hypothetical protein
MKASKPEKLPRNPLEVTAAIGQRSFATFRLIGYTLLLLSLLDYVTILLPPQLTNIAWEFQAIGQMVDHVWALLLGLVFVFLYGQNTIINIRQMSILKLLSWMSLLIGIIYILLVPLGINNSLTLYKGINNQFTTQETQQQEQLQKINEKLNLTDSPEQLHNLAKNLRIENESAPSQSTKELKTKISQRIETAVQDAKISAKATKGQQIKNLIKEALRINLGALISGVCFITFWNMTRWTRIIDKNLG